ncbi:hypothetical protein ASE04_29565 [Rhizobium sp. Root708]|uniref:hypothetical protein n=1 Tax=Rhizobium sp. Root708 TaxID=1736592 RepID=UPI0006F8DAD2|nr:hypothetical protein [Rhizobium sp. Root708]KRB53444.1 hypothetical protein ASE04_29565 [Rhizobium sp. Root708]
MTLVTDIHDACRVLPQLDGESRYQLIGRVLERLEAYLCYALLNVPADKRYWLEALVSSVRFSVAEIALLETQELLRILVEFEKLIGVLDEITGAVNGSPALH